MAITKRHVAVEELLGTFLRFTPNAADTDLFRSDMKILNTTVLSDAIKECIATSPPNPPQRMAQRSEIHKVYTRKLKEMASLYPFIFMVENALRNAAAEHYSKIFGTDTWWTTIVTQVDAGRDEAHYTVGQNGQKNIRGIPVSPRFIKQIFFCIKGMNVTNGNKIRHPDVIDELYPCLTLSSLWMLIEADWTLSRQMFVSDNELGGVLRKQDMIASFRVMTIARNELFHSNPVGDVSKISRACENILDKLGLHLGDVDKMLAATQIQRIVPTAVRANRHVVPPDA